MANDFSRRPNFSISFTEADSGGDGTNNVCHGFTGGVQANSKHVIDTPQIVLILWDILFVNNSAAVTSVKQLVTDLITGPFMNGLAQYGVARGTLVDTVVIDTRSYPAPASWDAVGGNDLKQLKLWFTDKKVVTPPKDEAQRVYLIILPNTTQLTNGSNSDKTPNTSVGGWHSSAKYNDDSGNNDLFWGLVKTIGNTLVAGSEAAFVNGFAFGVAHELCEAFTNRDGNGYINTNNCEIGDICEADIFNNAITFTYKTWTVEPYWSTWDNACIHGDVTVSLGRFLTAISFDPNIQPINALGTSILNLDYIASRMR